MPGFKYSLNEKGFIELFLRCLVNQVHELVKFRSDDNLGATITLLTHYMEKNKQLFLKQKQTLEMFLERGAISKAQHDISLRDLKGKTGIET